MIVLSLPYLPDIELNKAYEQIVTHIEYRLDYHPAPFSFPEKFINENSILTLRSAKEGGKYDLSHKQKLDYYTCCIKKYNCLVDWEFLEYEHSSINPQNLIISYHHNPKDELNYDVLAKELSETEAKYCKLVLPINHLEELNRVFRLIKTVNKPVLFCGTGRYGKLSRILYNHLGATGTYIGASRHKTHPDQLTMSEAELYRLNTISSKTLLGGIVGGKQVYHSLGLGFFNQYFEENNINARYLPFHLDNFGQILRMLSVLLFQNLFYGFSVTMPFKQQLADKLNSKLPLNTYIPKDSKTTNTDIDGFMKALAYLEVAADDKILIIGSGATALSALFACKEYDTYITARNHKKVTEIAREHRVKYISQSQAKHHFFDIVINCTPIGMQSEDIIEITGIRNFAKFIDLPYTSGNTPVVSYCIANQISYVDGKRFWQWQARAQLHYFLSAISDKHNRR